MLSTPKSKFYDDSFVKYTSPDLRTNEPFQEQFNQDDMSRRFSIDSFSRSGNNNATMVVPSFNRFNAISENEFEEPDINQKSFHIESSTNGLHRLSTLQTRNLQTKPHLKSSYALDFTLPAVSEHHIRGDVDNKENNRVSLRIEKVNWRIIFFNLF